MGNIRRQHTHRTHPSHTPETPRILTARFSGKCAVTGKHYSAGETIISRGNGWELYDSTAPNPAPTNAAATPNPVGKFEFEDVTHLIDAAAATDPARHRSADSRPDSWNGNCTFAGAIEMARHGWHDGVKAISAALETLPPVAAPESTAGTWDYDVAGDNLDISRAIEGDPECFQTYEPLAGDGKVVEFIYSISYHGGYSGAEITRRGAELCAIAQQLEAQGYSVKLSLWFASDDGKTKPFLCEFKGAGEPLELDRAAFLLTNPATLRRIMFSLLENVGVNVGCTRPDNSARPDPTKHAGAYFFPATFEGEPLLVCRNAGLIA